MRHTYPFLIAAVVAAAVAGCSNDAADPNGAGGQAGGSGGAGGAGGVLPPAPDPAGFRETAPISVARNGHTATLLHDARVLVVGGELVLDRTQLAQVDIFDPITESWTVGPSLPEPRSSHVATRLQDGRVLVTGGGKSTRIGSARGEEVRASALLFDPSTDSWQATGAMAEARSHFAAALLPSGRVLVVGGGGDTHLNGSECTGVPDCGPEADTLASAELYEPATGAFTATGSLAEARFAFTLTSLPDGRAVAVAGAYDVGQISHATSEVFDEANGQWSAGPTLVYEDRLFHSAALLPSGRVPVLPTYRSPSRCWTAGWMQRAGSASPTSARPSALPGPTSSAAPSGPTARGTFRTPASQDRSRSSSRTGATISAAAIGRRRAVRSCRRGSVRLSPCSPGRPKSAQDHTSRRQCS